MKKIITFFIVANFSLLYCNAQKVTWSQDIACIVYSHCTRCHNNSGSIAAIPLTNYYEAWSQRNAIKYYVENRLMPPHQPSTETTRYINEKNLTQEEIGLIVTWVDQGTNQGDSTLVPPAPVIEPLKSQILFPDFSQRISAYTVPDTVGFQYHCFVFPTTYPTEKKISEIEILPTDLSAVYSAFLYSDTSSVPLALDAADTGNGYENYAGIGSPTAKLLYGWVNGNPLYKSPPNMAIRLDANAHLVLRILFAEDALTKTDSTTVNIKFDTSTATRAIDIGTLLNYTVNLQNPPFVIPADSIKTFYEQYTVPNDITLLGVSHWAHKFCINMNCYAVTPTNDTINLLQIEDHEDLWSQGFYYFYKPIKIPKHSILYAEAEYDNTSVNPNNPFTPSHTIVAGIADTTEQMSVTFSYLPYQKNDENIITDTVKHQIHYLNCSPAHTVNSVQDNPTISTIDWVIFPNPAGDYVSITLDLKESVKLLIDVTDLEGKQVAVIIDEKQSGTVNKQFNTATVPAGNYLIRLQVNGKNYTQKLNIVH
ncbi:MAG: T9SS type A sorting domain-containing protein [Bacteroidetes bacterium]|nr:T9SS type A sorting domain-containing protein [Bacteroidota bacterium]